MWAMHVNTLCRRRLILFCMFEWMCKSICKDPETSPFNRYWTNYVAINCMQDPLLMSSVVLIILWVLIIVPMTDNISPCVCACTPTLGVSGRLSQLNMMTSGFIPNIHHISFTPAVHVKQSRLSHWFHCAWHFRSKAFCGYNIKAIVL